MIAAYIITVICGSLLVAWHMWVTSRVASDNDRCACGHAAAFHKNGGGCKHAHDGSTDCYGYCTCQRSYAEVGRTALLTVPQQERRHD